MVLCPVNLVFAMFPLTSSTSNCNLMYCLEKSPVNSLMVTSTVLPYTSSGSLAGVVPISLSPNATGVLMGVNILVSSLKEKKKEFV